MSIHVLKQNFMPKTKHMFAIVVFLCACLSSCQTLDVKNSEAEVAEKLLQSQKEVVVRYLNSSEAAKAHAELRRLLSANPKDTELQNLMGLTQLSLGYSARALQYFRAAYNKERTGTLALNISSALIALKKNKEAISFIQKSRKKHSDYAYPERFYHNLGLAWENLKRTKNAEKYYRLALSENPSNYITLVKLGQIYKKTKRPKLAAQQFARASRECPACLEPTNHIVEQQLRSGNVKLAKNTLAKYIATNEVSDSDKQKATELLKKIESRPSSN